MSKYLFAFLVFLGTTSFGQLHSVGFHLGGMGTSLGKSFSNVDSKIKIDYTGGLNYQYRFTTHLTLGANIEYTQFGARVRVQEFGFTGNLLSDEYSSWDWNYISVPLIVGYEMGGKISFKPKAALVPSILNRMIYNFIPSEGSTLSPFKESHYSDANKIDLGAMVGVDISARINSGVFFAAIDMRYSLTKVNSDALFSTTLYDPYRHASISATIGMRFNLGNPEDDDGPGDIIDDPIE